MLKVFFILLFFSAGFASAEDRWQSDHAPGYSTEYRISTSRREGRGVYVTDRSYARVQRLSNNEYRVTTPYAVRRGVYVTKRSYVRVR